MTQTVQHRHPGQSVGLFGWELLVELRSDPRQLRLDFGPVSVRSITHWSAGQQLVDLRTTRKQVGNFGIGMPVLFEFLQRCFGLFVKTLDQCFRLLFLSSLSDRALADRRVE